MKRTITTIVIMALVFACGYFVSACSSSKGSRIRDPYAVHSITEEPAEEATDEMTEEPAEEATDEMTEEMTEESFSGIYPEVVPETSREHIILDDMLEATYYIWLPGDKPQTWWRRSHQTSDVFRLTSDTAIVEYNGVLSSGKPDNTGTVYVLSNLASVSAIRQVCWNAELNGAHRVVVCDISTYHDWFQDFVERRIESV